MRSAPTRCPVCQSELSVTRLHCGSCDTVIEGRFEAARLANLDPEQIEFLVAFVRNEGRINRMEQEGGWGSYPTIRNRLHGVVRALGIEPGRDETAEILQEKRRAVLADLESGKIKPDDAMRILKGEEA